MLELIVVFAVRLLLVSLFLPFSALDKLLNFGAAVDQAATAVRHRPLAVGLIFAGLGVEVCMSLAVLCGMADRLAALVLAAYCIATALLWKQFWRTSDFRLKGPSQGREMFWDFMKNLSLAGGFLLLTFGANAAGVQGFIDQPFASSQPYGPIPPGVTP